MKIIKKIAKTIEESEVVDKEICDVCGQDIVDCDGFRETTVNINASQGDYYPECNCMTGYIIDCCFDCFYYKIRPLIENKFKVNFREVKMDDAKHEDFHK